MKADLKEKAYGQLRCLPKNRQRRAGLGLAERKQRSRFKHTHLGNRRQVEFQRKRRQTLCKLPLLFLRIHRILERGAGIFGDQRIHFEVVDRARRFPVKLSANLFDYRALLIKKMQAGIKNHKD